MAVTHEFGIMQKNPGYEEVFESYEPEKYNCICIDDDFINAIAGKLQIVDCYWHTLQRPEKGLAYYGITLIPPESIESFINILSVQNDEVYTPLIYIANRARKGNKYLIHFGI